MPHLRAPCIIQLSAAWKYKKCNSLLRILGHPFHLHLFMHDEITHLPIRLLKVSTYPRELRIYLPLSALVLSVVGCVCLCLFLSFSLSSLPGGGGQPNWV